MTAVARDGTATVHVARATAPEVPAGEGWLTDAEVRVHGTLRLPKRAADWRLGRWVAKGAVRAALDPWRLSPEVIEVLAAPGGAPAVRLLVPRRDVVVTLSLSHSGGFGFAAASPTRMQLGCDVETVEPRSDAFVSDYFTPAEERWIRAEEAESDTRANLLWSAKESALKAMGEGLRMDTRRVEVEAVAGAGPDPTEWRALAVATGDGAVFPGLWRLLDGRTWTVVADRPFRLA